MSLTSDDWPLRSAFEQLTLNSDPHARGLRFEALVRLLFEASGFHATLNPGAAWPRQTDLHARRGEMECIIEVKWRGDAATIDDIDSFRARLGRVSTRVTGIFFSMSGFAETSISNAEQDRRQDLVLFQGAEIEALFGGEMDLVDAIQKKRRTYIRDGRVYFIKQRELWWGLPAPDQSFLPEPVSHVWTPAKGRLPWFTGGGRFGTTVFVQHLPDVDWTIAQGFGVGMDLSLPLDSAQDLDRLLDLLRRTIGLSGWGTYTIQQDGTAWFGTGARSYLNAVASRNERYSATQPRTRIHHTEETSYFDVCRDGLLTFRADLSSSGNQVFQCEFSLQLSGLPVDTTPYRDLADALGAHSRTYFRPLAGGALTPPVNIGGRSKIDALEPLAYLRDADGQWITGVIAVNPLKDDSWPDATLDRDGELSVSERQHLRDLATHLAEFDFVMCNLGEYHQSSTSVDYYYLRSIQGTVTSSVTVACLTANWHQLASEEDTDREYVEVEI